LKLPKIIKDRHKYQTGYIVAFAGSKELPGAAKLAGLAALRSGAGIVRIFSPTEIGTAPVELICNLWNEKSWQEELKRAKAVFVGPGLGNQKGWLKRHLSKISLPCVVDGDALLPDLKFPKTAILTPHRGEALRLLKLQKEDELVEQLTLFCEKNDLVIVLKGSPTRIFAPRRKLLEIDRGDPGMAKAGTGDVLTGIIAAFLAQGMSPYESAVLGVTCHGIAGEEAAKSKSSYCMIASDLIEMLPAAFRTLQTI
jgi:ADP-dependent NAD(P)H-hydrate dehydratase / NAD(P)H-hydrate epimerase